MTATKPRGRGQAKATIELMDAAYAILAEINPATVRATCYKLFVRGLIPNMSKGSTDKVSKVLVHMRENGTLPWDWVVDETRKPERIAQWSSPTEIIASAVNQYRKDYWADQPERVEVWTEKGTLRGTLAPVLDEYGITLRVMGGYGSATTVYNAAQDSVASDKPLVVLYAGDWDPSGLHMSAVDLPDRITRYGGELNLRRVALTADDVAGDLPSFDAATKSGDPRHRWFSEHYGSRCWEVDALSPVVLRERVGAEITALLDMDLWNHAIKIEEVERGSMSDFLATWKDTISGQAPKYPEGAA